MLKLVPHAPCCRHEVDGLRRARDGLRRTGQVRDANAAMNAKDQERPAELPRPQAKRKPRAPPSERGRGKKGKGAVRDGRRTPERMAPVSVHRVVCTCFPLCAGAQRISRSTPAQCAHRQGSAAGNRRRAHTLQDDDILGGMYLYWLVRTLIVCAHWFLSASLCLAPRSSSCTLVFTAAPSWTLCSPLPPPLQKHSRRNQRATTMETMHPLQRPARNASASANQVPLGRQRATTRRPPQQYRQ
jgi:hypothetical protein